VAEAADGGHADISGDARAVHREALLTKASTYSVMHLHQAACRIGGCTIGIHMAPVMSYTSVMASQPGKPIAVFAHHQAHVRAHQYPSPVM
jgi:hypothetical protein